MTRKEKDQARISDADSYGLTALQPTLSDYFEDEMQATGDPWRHHASTKRIESMLHRLNDQMKKLHRKTELAPGLSLIENVLCISTCQ